MTDPTTAELRRIVDEDRPHPLGPDLDALTGAGRRKLRQRRTRTGVATLAVLGVLVVPTAVVASGWLGDPGARPDRTSVAAGPEGDGERACGTLICVRPGTDGAPDEGELLGEPWVIDGFPSGADEIIYGVGTPGDDPSTGRTAAGVLKQGYREDGRLYAKVWGVEVGTDRASPDGRPRNLRAEYAPLGDRRADDFSVVGYVEGTPAQVTWSTPDGDHGPVDAMSTTVMPGYTVFYVVRPLPEGFERGGYTRVHGDDGDAIQISPGDEFPPSLTIHTSDGWSCSLTDCGVIG